MNRRELLALSGGASAWGAGARGQATKRIIGFLGPTTEAAWHKYVPAFASRLAELGWTDGRDIAVIYRWSDGRDERNREIAEEFVRDKADIIVTGGTAAAATRRATSTTPIVLAVANDPVGDGLAENLARPGGNVTGMSVIAPQLAGKRLDNLRRILPSLRRLTVLGNANYRAAVQEMNELQTLARTLGIEVDTLAVRTTSEIAPAISDLKGRTDALYVSPDSLTASNSTHINALALAGGIPTMHGVREFVEDGGLMSYGPNLVILFQRAGDYVDKILRGARAGELPIEQPTKFELVINLKTAKALNIAVSDSLLMAADDVIE